MTETTKKVILDLRDRWDSGTKWEKGLAVFFFGLGMLTVVVGPKPINRVAGGVWMLMGAVVGFAKPATHQQFVVMPIDQLSQDTAEKTVAIMMAVAREHSTNKRR